MIPWPSILRSLTPEQREFATSMKPRIELVAGPGTGKTYAIAARVAWLVSQMGIYPSEILVAVFSNAAKDAIQRRLSEWGMDEFTARPKVTTLHAYAVGHSFACWEALGVPGYEVASEEECENVLTGLLTGPMKRKDIAALGIREVKRVLTLWDAGALDPVPAEAYVIKARDHRLREMGKVALSDVIRLVMRFDELLRSKGAYQGVRFVLVDEAHDITAMERHYVERIASTNQAGVTLVHDPRQRIFEWRGSRAVDGQQPPDAQHLALTHSHRFGSKIADFANRIASRISGASTDLKPNPSLGEGDVRFEQGDFGYRGTFMPWAALGHCIQPEDPRDVVVLVRSNREAALIQDTWPSSVAKAMTVHQAKGHEWDEVILLTTPFWPNAHPKEEDWRILFVGATRARHRLRVIFAPHSPVRAVIEEFAHHG